MRNLAVGHNSALGFCIPVRTSQPMGLFASFVYESRMLKFLPRHMHKDQRDPRRQPLETMLPLVIYLQTPA